MDWQPTTNNPLGIYFDAGPVVVGIDTDDGGGESLQVTGPTSLDDQTIVTDGGGNLTVQGDGGVIVQPTPTKTQLTLLNRQWKPLPEPRQGQVAAGGHAGHDQLSANKRPLNCPRHRRREHEGVPRTLPRQWTRRNNRYQRRRRLRPSRSGPPHRRRNAARRPLSR